MVDSIMNDRGNVLRLPDVRNEPRAAKLGATKDGRILLVIYRQIGNRVRVITARDAVPAERRHHEGLPHWNAPPEEADDDKLIPVHSLDEIPDFTNDVKEDEEDEFWATHCLGEELLGQMERR